MLIEDTTIQDLTAADRMFRLFAIENILRDGDSETLLSAVTERIDQEQDPECLMLLRHAKSALQERLGLGESPAASAVEWADRFSKATVEGRLKLLWGLPAAWTQEIARGPALRWFQAETDAAVIALLIRHCGRFWPPEAVAEVRSRMSGTPVNVQAACLEFLIQFAPDSLEESLPAFLSSRDPKIRALGIRALARIDEEEAVAHLDGLLAGTDVRGKMAGLQQALHLPFALVKPIFWLRKRILPFCLTPASSWKPIPIHRFPFGFSKCPSRRLGPRPNCSKAWS